MFANEIRSRVVVAAVASDLAAEARLTEIKLTSELD